MGSCVRLARAVSNVKVTGIQVESNVHLNTPGRSGGGRGRGSGPVWALGGIGRAAQGQDHVL